MKLKEKRRGIWKMQSGLVSEKAIRIAILIIVSAGIGYWIDMTPLLKDASVSYWWAGVSQANGWPESLIAVPFLLISLLVGIILLLVYRKLSDNLKKREAAEEELAAKYRHAKEWICPQCGAHHWLDADAVPPPPVDESNSNPPNGKLS